MKKTISILLSFLMVFSVISSGVGVLVASAETADDENFLLSTPEPPGVPDYSDPNYEEEHKKDKDNPYGKQPERVFSLATMNELYFYESRNHENENTTDWNAWTFDNCSTTHKSYSDGTYWLKDPNLTNSSPTVANVGAQKDLRLSYVQSIGFDPTGSGKKDHIAMIGYSNYQKSGKWTYHTYIVVQDLKSAGQPSYYYDLDTSDWAQQIKLDYYLGSAYFEIAAGDFDDDGQDTLIAYCPSDSHNIWEVSFSGGEFTSKVITSVTALRPDSANLLTDADRQRSQWEFKPTVSFAVGDFDGDGVDNLAISTGFGNPSKEDNDNNTGGLSKTNTSFERYVTSVSVMNLSGTSWSVEKTEFMYSKKEKKTETAQAVTYTFDAMHMGAITAGDINNDGYDEIVAVGYTSNNSKCMGKIYKNAQGVEDPSLGVDVTALGDIAQEEFAYSIISRKPKTVNNTTVYYYTKTDLQQIKMNKLEKNHFHHDNNSMWPQIQVAAGYTNGQSSKAEIFIDGVIYEGSTGTLSASYTPKIFDQTFETIMGGNTNVYRNFVAQVAVGNFDSNVAGREQFVYTLAFQEATSSGKATRDYAVYLGIVGGCVFDDTATDYGGITDYGCSNIRGSSGNWVDIGGTDASKCIYNKGDNWTDKSGKCLNVVVCAVDIDDDGLLGRYNSHKFITSDPSPLAVLQASPYFEALDDLGAYNDNGGTAYTVGYSFEKTTMHGHSVSFGVGFAGELQIGTFRGSLEVGYTLDWSETYEKGFTKEYNYTFMITEDSVLVSIVPVHVYTYDIWNPTGGSDGKGAFVENEYNVSVPAEPVYSVMSIDEYNAAVDIYNDYIEHHPPEQNSGRPTAHKLKKITYGTQISSGAVLPNALGNPYAYQNWTQLNGAQISSPAGDTLIGTSTNGGTSEADFTYSTSSSHSTEMDHGFSFSLCLQGGGKGQTVEGWAGGYVSLDYSYLSGTTVSKSKSEGCTCTVANPKYENVKNYMTYQDLSNYFFKWKLGQWSVGLVEGSTQTTPVIGYFVTEVTSPPSPPKNLEASSEPNANNSTKETITLTWDASDSIPFGPGVAGYNVYDYGVQLNSNPITNTSFVMSGAEVGVKHSFTVKAVSSQTNYLSPPSNEAILGWISPAVGIVSITKDATYTSADGLTDKYVILFSDESTSEFYIRNGKDGTNGQDGQDGQDGQTAYEAAVENGYTGTYEEWLMVIGAACVEGHTYTTYTQAASCTQDGITLSVCSVCGKAAIEVEAHSGHEYGEETFAPTCTERGYTMHTCAKCGDQYFTDFTDASGHDYVGVKTEPTCVDQGYTTYTCSVCGDTYVADITPAAGHDYESVVTEPTCVDQGYTTYTCPSCGDTYVSDITPAVGHDYVAVTTDPTCTHKGFTTYTCSVCGNQYIDDLTDVTAHSFKTKVVESTCVSGGFTLEYCEYCGFMRIADESQAAGHSFVKTETVAPTCLLKGYSVYTCSTCGVSYTADEVGPIAHTWQDKVIAPTCRTEGYTIHTCSACGYAYIDGATPVKEHTPGKWICEDPTEGRYVIRCEECYMLLDVKYVTLDPESTGLLDNPYIGKDGVMTLEYKKTTRIVIDESVTNGNAVVYTSSDPDVVTVDADGNVTAVGPGEAIVTARVAGTSIQMEIPVKVKMNFCQRIIYQMKKFLLFICHVFGGRAYTYIKEDYFS